MAEGSIHNNNTRTNFMDDFSNTKRIMERLNKEGGISDDEKNFIYTKIIYDRHHMPIANTKEAIKKDLYERGIIQKYFARTQDSIICHETASLMAKFYEKQHALGRVENFKDIDLSDFTKKNKEYFEKECLRNERLRNERLRNEYNELTRAIKENNIVVGNPLYEEKENAGHNPLHKDLY